MADLTVVDASVLIAHLDFGDVHHEEARELLERSEGAALAASQVTVAEVLLGPARAGRLEAARGALGELGVEEIALPADGSVRLARLRAETGMRLPDCCVLLAALERTASLTTFDDRLRRAATGLGTEVV